MTRPPALFALALALAASAFGGLAAQTSGTGLDLDAIRARAAEQADDATRLGETARARARSVTQEARRSADQGLANGQRHARTARAIASAPADQPFDFDRLVADAGAFDDSTLGEAPRFIAFVSTSMPTSALKQMFNDVSRAGGVVVFRGFPSGSAKALTASLARVISSGEAPPGVGIDPRLFRAFGVAHVPAYVVAGSDFDLCDGFDCTSQLPPHDRISGNVTPEHALETFAQGGGPGARIAALHLERLRKSRP